MGADSSRRLPPPPTYKNLKRQQQDEGQQKQQQGAAAAAEEPPPPSYEQVETRLEDERTRSNMVVIDEALHQPLPYRLATSSFFSTTIPPYNRHRTSNERKDLLEAQLKQNYPVKVTVIYCCLLAVSLILVFVCEVILLLKNGSIVFPIGITYSVLSVSVIFSFAITGWLFMSFFSQSSYYNKLN